MSKRLYWSQDDSGFKVYDRYKFLDSKNIVFGTPRDGSWEVEWKKYGLDTGPLGEVKDSKKVKGEKRAKILARTMLRSTIVRIRPSRRWI